MVLTFVMDTGQHLTPDSAMSLAIQQAKKGLGWVSPNPPVGAVFVNSQGQCLSTGYHKKYGEDHAEIMALKHIQDSSQLKGASLYVTLEPCTHTGLTPPCVDRIARMPISKVCVGLLDPNPKVNGKGVQFLKEKGIQVELYQGALQENLKELIEVFDYNLRYRKPFVGVKIASTLDGCITMPQRKWLTGTASRSHVSLLRGHYDAVCIGLNTFIKDDPRLNSRHVDFVHKENTVILLDPEGKSLSLLKKSKICQVRSPDKVIVVVSDKQPQLSSSFSVLRCPVDHQGWFDLDNVMTQLFARNVRSVLVEGGGIVFSRFLPISQRLFLFLAPLIAGHKSYWNLQQLSFSLKKAHFLAFESDILMTGLISKNSTQELNAKL